MQTGHLTGCGGTAVQVHINPSYLHLLEFFAHKTKKSLHISDKAALYYPHKQKLQETDHFDKAFSLETATKGTLFVCEQFSTSRHSMCLLAMGLDTSRSSVRVSAWLLSYEHVFTNTTTTCLFIMQNLM